MWAFANLCGSKGGIVGNKNSINKMHVLSGLLSYLAEEHPQSIFPVSIINTKNNIINTMLPSIRRLEWYSLDGGYNHQAYLQRSLIYRENSWWAAALENHCSLTLQHQEVPISIPPSSHRMLNSINSLSVNTVASFSFLCPFWTARLQCPSLSGPSLPSSSASSFSVASDHDAWYLLPLVDTVHQHLDPGRLDHCSWTGWRQWTMVARGDRQCVQQKQELQCFSEALLPRFIAVTCVGSNRPFIR